MKEIDLPNVTEWIETDNKNSFKIFKRHDESLIIQIKRAGDKEASIQADLDYVIDTYIRQMKHFNIFNKTSSNNNKRLIE